MTPVVVDTNVAVVADGSAGTACEVQCVRALAAITRAGGLLLDAGGLILLEYTRRLGFAGQPGAGRAFVKWAHDNQCVEERCRRIPIQPIRDAGWRRFLEFPDDMALHGFDPADQKFVAVALASGLHPEILNATDTDWRDHRAALESNGVRIRFLCPELLG